MILKLISLRMKYHTKDLLTLLISLFVLGGCQNPSGIGLEVDPGNEIVGTLTDTLTLQAATFLDDSARSSAFSETAFGLFDDPVIGKTVADLALAIGRPSSVPRIRPDAEIDSVILVLPYGREYFGDTVNSVFPLQVRQLDEAYTDGTYSTKQWAVRDEVIGSRTIARFAYKQTDSINVRKHIDGKDTVVKVIPQLRVALSPAFFKTLFSESVDSAALSTEAGFNDHVKGLYLSVDESAMSGIGGLVTFRGVSEVTGIELTYRQPNGEDGDDAGTDTIRTFLPTTVTDPSGSTFRRLATSIRRSYSAEVQAQLDSPGLNHGRVYAQAPAGLRTRLRIPYLDSLKGRNIAVNKAELVIYVDEAAPAGGTFNAHAPRLTLYREDIAGQRLPVPDGDSRSGPTGYYGQQGYSGDPRSLWYRYGNHWEAFGGGMESQGKRYVFRLTSYVQDLLLGRINAAEFYLAPAAVSDGLVPYYPVLNTGGRAVISNSDSLKIKLNIYYTQAGK